MNSSEAVRGCRDGAVVDIAVRDYLKLPAFLQTRLRAFRASVEFNSRAVARCAYDVGLALVADQAERIPTGYRINDRQTRLLLLAGLLDACGELAGSGVRLALGASATLRDDVLFLARSVGISARDSQARCAKKRKRQLSVLLSGRALADVPCRSLRVPMLCGESDVGETFSTALLRVGDYFGFTIDGNHRFVLGSLVVTHNTTTINAIARQLYGPTHYKSRMLELNASDERGIGVVRDKIKSFAALTVGSRPADSKYPMPPYKLVILDEADSMTGDAQAALRRIMENYSKATRFCLICNYVSRIIEPLASRCAKFRFRPLAADAVEKRLSHVASAEGVQVDAATLTALRKVSGGDMRKAITFMQVE